MAPIIAAAAPLLQFVPDLVGWLAGDNAEKTAQKIIGVAKEITGKSGNEAVEALSKNPEALLKFKQRALELKNELEIERLRDKQDEREKRYSIISAEANSKDMYIARARPTFMYIFYFLIISLVIVAPFFGVFFPEEMKQFYANVGAGFNAIPDALWATFVAGFSVYTTARTYEKYKGVAK